MFAVREYGKHGRMAAALIVGLAMVGCSDDDERRRPRPDAATDVGPDAPSADVGPDVSVGDDAGFDAGGDVGGDVGPDAGLDAGGDVGGDVGPDAGPTELGALQLVEVASGFTSPVTATSAGDGSGRLFIVDQVGLIRVIDAQGDLQAEPFGDLSSLLVEFRENFDERGLLGLAFHPNFETNERLFVYYSAPLRAEAPQDFDHTNVLSEFSVGDDGTVDLATERKLIEVDHPAFNHNGGTVAFGPDGFLYMSIGDGGNKNDIGLGHPELGNGQDITTIHGSILRIDVDSGDPYGIPATNPFADAEGVDEIFAYGFRNPYRFAFDTDNGDLWVADAGQNLMEEVSLVEVGQNYGWNIKEGTLCFNPADELAPPDSCASEGPEGKPLIDPVLTYTHPVDTASENAPLDILMQSDIHGLVVIGGFPYRGSALTGYDGVYVFADWSLSFGTPSGQILLGVPSDGGYEVQVAELTQGQPLGVFVLGFGRDADGELYVLSTENLGPSGTTGKVWRLELAP